MLKPFAQMLERDPRFEALMVPDGKDSFRPMERADHHAAIAEIEVSAATPKAVKRIFSRARHALLYAWFDYELTPLAEAQAFAALEVALRDRLQMKGTLRPLLEKAVKEQLVPSRLGQIDLPFAVAHMRNHHAHGNDHFGSPGMTLDVLRLIAALINGLYLSTSVKA